MNGEQASTSPSVAICIEVEPLAHHALSLREAVRVHVRVCSCIVTCLLCGEKM